MRESNKGRDSGKREREHERDSMTVFTEGVKVKALGCAVIVGDVLIKAF